MYIPTYWRFWGAAALAFAMLALAGCGTGQQTEPARAQPAAQPASSAEGQQPPLDKRAKSQIEAMAADLHTHIATLASDAFAGRAPATEGEALTVNYLAEQFQLLGLEPGGVDANGDPSWFQQVPVVEMQIESTPLVISAERAGQPYRKVLQPVVDMVSFTQRQFPSSALKDSELVFVGYGIVAPEYNWNDYAGLDMRGKTAVILVNDPGYATADKGLFNGRAMTYYGRWSYKFEEAARQGAEGAIVIHETGAAGYPWEVVSGSWSGSQISLAADDKNIGRVAVESWITGAAAEALFSAAGLDLKQQVDAAKQRGFKSRPMGLFASISLTNQLSRSNSRNVIARLPGTTHADEAIVYTAHWDHLGVNDTIEGPDPIFNGAIDNASGTAGLLAMARQARGLPTRPQRSLLFVALTAEESGLLGSQHYADNPVVPLSKTVAGINFDSLEVFGPMRDVVVVGRGNSELEMLLASVAKQQGRYLTAEAHPERGYFYRSDHFNLAKKGVPTLYYASGDDSFLHGLQWGRAKSAEYTAQTYHKPTDEYDPQWNLQGAAMDLQLALRLGIDLANSRDWPNWFVNNEFRAIRDASAAERE